MTEAEVRQRYPGAVNAVLLHEGMGPAGDMIPAGKAKGRTAEQIVAALRWSARMTLEIIPGGPIAVILPELGHPDFLHYVRNQLSEM